MSSQPGPALVPLPEPAKEIPELTDAYRKAHKSYVLASGLLAAWELIGISLKTGEKWGIELKSPAAVPLILFVLVIYSGYKTGIEWWQCNPERKQHPAAKWDYRIAHGIASLAIAISIVQYLLHAQIVDLLARHDTIVFACLVSLGSVIATRVFKILAFESLPGRQTIILALTFGLTVQALAWAITVLLKRSYRESLGALCFAIPGTILSIYLILKLRKRTAPDRKMNP